MQGKISAIHNNGRSVFSGLPSKIKASRYHSLAIEHKRLSDYIEITWTEDDEGLFADIKQAARRTDQSMPGHTREVLKQELDTKNVETHKTDFSDFRGIWQDYDITQGESHSKAWK